MEENYTIQQSIIKHGVDVDLLIELAKLASDHGHAFKVVSRFENSEEAPRILLVGHTDTTKINVDLVFSVTADVIKSVALQISTLPKPGKKPIFLQGLETVEAIETAPEETFEKVITQLSSAIAGKVLAAITTDFADDVLFDLESPEW